jgi:dihydroorotase
MAYSTLLRNVLLVNEGTTQECDVLIVGEKIHRIGRNLLPVADHVIEARGAYLLPGVIDDQVHFREPGLTHKGDLYTESRAAVAGGITTYMEMPNTVPAATTQELLQQKYDAAKVRSFANYSFYIGATNNNLEELKKTSRKKVSGIKIFMGSSTGDLLVDDPAALESIFRECPQLIATHCEHEPTIRANSAVFKDRYGDNVTAAMHPEIRTDEVCYMSSSHAVELARKHNSRLHILHLSSARELSLFRNDIPLREKRITAEACVHHLWFSSDDYERLGFLIKWNPAIKTKADRAAIWEALLDNRLDVIATDHAPHTLEEKQRNYWQAPSGGPLVQHSLQAMLTCADRGQITIERVVEKMCHAVADCFRIEKRGYVREGYYADLVLVDRHMPYVVSKENILYKCGWSPFEGTVFTSSITHTFVNGQLVYHDGKIDENVRGKRIKFETEGKDD